jgi:hypothetical protein
MTDRVTRASLKQFIQGAHLNPRVERVLRDMVDSLALVSGEALTTGAGTGITTGTGTIYQSSIEKRHYAHFGGPDRP